MKNKIIISNNIKKEDFGKNCRIFEYETMLLEHAKAVVTEAFIAEYEEKNIVIIAKKIQNEAQNSLLKILEEPPKNIIFTIIVPRKNVLLPTIRSRLMIEYKMLPKARANHGLDLRRLDFRSACEFIRHNEEQKRLDKLSSLELVDIVNSIVCDAIDLGFNFSQKELEYFKKLSCIATLNTSVSAVLTPLMLLILQKNTNSRI